MKQFFNKIKSRGQVTIVAFGDSNTELTWHTHGRLNWVGLLQYALFEKYGTNRVRVINAGQCGDTASRAVERLDRDVIQFKPDLVIIGFGMNDAGEGEAGLNSFATALSRIVHDLREKCACDILLRSSNPVVVSNQPGLSVDFIPGQEWPGLHQGVYARRTVEIALKLNCPIIDHYTLWTQSAIRDEGLPQPTNHLWLRMSDAIHPGPLGHLYFYREMAPLFELPAFLPWEK